MDLTSNRRVETKRCFRWNLLEEHSTILPSIGGWTTKRSKVDRVFVHCRKAGRRARDNPRNAFKEDLRRAVGVDKWSSMNRFDLALAMIVRAGNSSSARQGPLPAEAMTLFTMPGCSRACIGRCHRSNCTLSSLSRGFPPLVSCGSRARSADTDYDSDGSAWGMTILRSNGEINWPRYSPVFYSTRRLREFTNLPLAKERFALAIKFRWFENPRLCGIWIYGMFMCTKINSEDLLPFLQLF